MSATLEMTTIPEEKPELVNVEPHKSLMQKIARGGYSPAECLAELIDNSLDSLLEGFDQELISRGVIEVSLPIRRGSITVKDNGLGMSEQDARKCLILGASSKRNALGMYGLGLKGAAIALGGKFTVASSPMNGNEEYRVVYDEEDWKETDGWHVPFWKSAKLRVSTHGTVIEIEKLRRPAYSEPEVDHLRKEIGRRYAQFIGDGRIEILINGIKAKAAKPELLEGPITFKVETEFGEITGWYGFLKRGSQIGAYGFDTYYKKRLITQYDKSFSGQHATISRLVGEVQLDFVPPQTTKRGWDTSSQEFRTAVEALTAHLKKCGALRRAHQLSAVGKLTPRAIQRTEELLDAVAQAMQTPDVLTLCPQAPFSPARRGSLGEASNDGLEDRRQVTIERRDEGTSSGTVEPSLEPAFTRTPKKTQLAERSVRIGSRSYKFRHEWKALGVDGPRKVSHFERGMLSVLSNLEHPGVGCTSDQSFYATENVAEGLSEFICQDGATWQRVAELRDTILLKTGEIQTGIKNVLD